MTRERVGRVPEADRQAREVRRAERGRLGDLRPHDGDAEQVGLELQQASLAAAPPSTRSSVRSMPASSRMASSRSATWNAMLSSAARAMWPAVVPRVMPTIVPRAYGSQCGAPRPANAGTRYTPPLSGTDAASGLDVGRLADDAQPVAQPLHHRAADEDAAFERVHRLAAELPGDGREQPVARRDRPLAGVLQHEAAGAVGVLRQPRRHAHLAEQRRLLIAGDAGDRDVADAERGRDAAVDLARRADLRQHAGRHAAAASADRRPTSAC